MKRFSDFKNLLHQGKLLSFFPPTCGHFDNLQFPFQKRKIFPNSFYNVRILIQFDNFNDCEWSETFNRWNNPFKECSNVSIIILCQQEFQIFPRKLPIRREPVQSQLKSLQLSTDPFSYTKFQIGGSWKDFRGGERIYELKRKLFPAANPPSRLAISNNLTWAPLKHFWIFSYSSTSLNPFQYERFQKLILHHPGHQGLRAQ